MTNSTIMRGSVYTAAPKWTEVRMMVDCANCIEKCPQAAAANDIAKGRMYATQEFIRVQKELERYQKAEAEGRLLVPPCKVGDTVYIIIHGKIYEGEIYHISYSDYYGKVTSAVWTKIDFLTASIGVAFEDFGKTAFFTRAAAEAALGKEETS